MYLMTTNSAASGGKRGAQSSRGRQARPHKRETNLGSGCSYRRKGLRQGTARGDRRTRRNDPRRSVRQFQEQGGALPRPYCVALETDCSAIEARCQPQGTVAYFRRDGRQRGAGSSKSGCRRDCISTIRADEQVNAVPSDKTERGHLPAYGEGITENCASERAAHVCREVCPHTGCNDYRLVFHVFSNAGTDNRRHYHHRI